ncbi:MAG: hypothetical protein K9N48_08505 [Verrucomicrobia bacterium]|nr:hypothetical protein [Verrucomicrobiota bacterium]
MDKQGQNDIGALIECLEYEPRELKFGTSGRRGDVKDLSQLEVYINALGELRYLKRLNKDEGGIREGDEFYFGYDLRPSSIKFETEHGGRGEIAQAIVQAITDAGLKPVNLGRIPTPAVMCYAIKRGKGSIMVTGSHIPFNRNGYKTNSAKGELMKSDEAPIGLDVERVRNEVYSQAFAESMFNEQGLFKTGHRELPPENRGGESEYIRRYTDFFGGKSLEGLRILVFQHSAVGRDMLVGILEELGAHVIGAGRSGRFIPIDTENVNEALIADITELVVRAEAEAGLVDAVVSTDGDSDRPMLLAVEHERGGPASLRFYGGDLVGMVTAEYIGADAVVVPISSNDGIDRGHLAQMVEPKTRIGSPYVIEGMLKAAENGRRRVCGWEANGGFMLGSDVESDGRVLAALPTRDAVLPILSVLFSAVEGGCAVSELFRRLPARYSRASLLKNFPRENGLKIIDAFSPNDDKVCDVLFNEAGVEFKTNDGKGIEAPEEAKQRMRDSRAALERIFNSELGFGRITAHNFTDGLRIYFDNSDVAHVRPSGNANELRIYAVADSQARADTIARFGVAEPDGLLRMLEKTVMCR